MSTMTRRKPTVTLTSIPAYGYLIGALTVLEEATADELHDYLLDRQTPGDTPWTVQGIARLLSWMQRQGYPVVRAPLSVARAYARAAGDTPPRSGLWRLEAPRTRAVREAMTQSLLLAVTDQRELRSRFL